ncbi:MAG: 2-hydroxyacyl-CoA dehydratase subunit D [Promethearchaeota archaeon]|jgi:benzoyl-CoA reductase/2-hydroxyglutaryl-CoA dehydratase subunit BcrC/BadD/HgdB
MDIEKFNEYKKRTRGNWGKDLSMLKMMTVGLLNQFKDDELTPITEMLLNYLLSIPKARKEGKKFVMHPFNYGPEIFYAMDLVPLMQETYSVGLAPLGLNEPYLDLTNKIGYGDNPTVCNAQRPLIGSYMQGVAPIPDLLFFLSTPCNSLAMTYQVFEQLASIPTFKIDIPYWTYDKVGEFNDNKVIDYMVTQTKELISWLEQKTDKKLNLENLQETMSKVNQARQYILEFNELLKTVPCPVNSQASFGNFLAMVGCGGTDDAVKSTKWLRDTAAENVKGGISGVPDEKIRIAWPYTHIFFDGELLTWIEETFQAVVVMDLLGFYQVLPHDVSTTEKCFESLAKGALDFSMIGTCRGPIEYYIEFLLDYVRDYKIDCVIMPMQFACKHAYSMARVSSEAVREEMDVPVYIFGCDPYDSREVTSESIRGGISDFITQVVL